MLIKEFRITLPLTVDEYKVAQLWSVAEYSKENTGGGEGVKVVRNEPFSAQPLHFGQYSEGQYTKKYYFLATKVPWWIRKLAPTGSLEVVEEAWNAYPYCRTVITNPGFMKEHFIIKVETIHLPDRGDTPNAHNLDPSALAKREVVHIDIANDPIRPDEYKASEDPKIYHSKKTGRGPLVDPDWQKIVTPCMTCYKLVTAEFKWLGLQTKVESFIMKGEHRLFSSFHRQLFCTMDKWHGLTIADIRKIEDETREQLDHERTKGTVRGVQEI